jgi:AI-2 transport protein TqsA
VAWAAPILAPFGLGLFLTALAAPFFGWLIAAGRSPMVAVTITATVVVVVTVALFVLAITSVQTLSESIAGYSDSMAVRYPDLAAALAGLGTPSGVQDALSPETLAGILRWVVELILAVGPPVAFAVVISILLLLDLPRLRRLRVAGLFDRSPVVRELPAIAGAAVTFFRVRIRVNAATALGLLALMVLVGVDHAPLWAVGAFFLSFVPYLGLVLALIPPAILAFAESGVPAALVILVGGSILNVVAENVLEPALTGRALELSTWVVFVMFFVWIWLLGPVGAVLAMPITVLIVLVLGSSERSRWVAQVMARD